jgi:hypothetical protein
MCGCTITVHYHYDADAVVRLMSQLGMRAAAFHAGLPLYNSVRLLVRRGRRRECQKILADFADAAMRSVRHVHVCRCVVASTFVLALGASPFVLLVMISVFALAMVSGTVSVAIAAACS